MIQRQILERERERTKDEERKKEREREIRELNMKR
jgi:hypothetical protein